MKVQLMASLCETCSWMRAIVTPKGSRFLLCTRSQVEAEYPRYPTQPVVRCKGYEVAEAPKTDDANPIFL
jgi:hypothetical protein